MDNYWEAFYYILSISLLLVLASLLRQAISKFSKRVIIPTSIIAGFIGLFLGKEVLNLLSMNQETLGMIVYHLMAIGFIAISLIKREKRKTNAMVKSGMFIVSGYLIQGIIGLSVVFIIMAFFDPNIFVGLGLLLPLGFGQGPGQAFSIGSQWEKIGFTTGGNIGLSIATIGFVWATIIGLPLMNYLIRKKKNDQVVLNKMTKIMRTDKAFESSDSIDTLTTQLILIGFAYFLTYTTLQGLTTLLSNAGTFGASLSALLWGFHFNIGAAYGILIRFVLNRLEENNIISKDISKPYILQRISGTSFDFMITASISAISLVALKSYVFPIIIITTLGGLATILYTNYILTRTLEVNKVENIIAFYGMQTGTISTGMALLKGVDPYFHTDAAENLVLGSAFAMLIGLPLMILINLPIIGYINNQPLYYIVTMILFIMYLGFLLFMQLKKTNKETTVVINEKIS
jgi:ESS family glutamate:Na+ symporter